MIKAIGTRIYWDSWLTPLASLLGIQEGARDTRDFRTVPLWAT